jgi:hypothetical protein
VWNQEAAANRARRVPAFEIKIDRMAKKAGIFPKSGLIFHSSFWPGHLFDG